MDRLPQAPLWVRATESAIRLTGGGSLSLDAGQLIKTSGCRFDDESFREALNQFCRAFDQDRSLTFLGRRALRWMIVDALRRRERVESDVKAHREIAVLPLVRPIFILGPPRTGTTFLQQLLGLDPDARWLRPWEIQTPYPEKAKWGTARDERRTAHDITVEKARRRDQGLETIHSADSPAECWQLLWASFDAHTMFLFFGLREAYRQWQRTTSKEWDLAAYRFYRLQLQHLMWLQPGGYWVLKAPEHTVHLPALLEVFPDAILIQMNRKPAEYVPSLCSLAWYCQFTTVWNCREHTLGAQVVRTMSEWERINRTDRAGIGRGRVIDIDYHDLVTDPIETVTRISGAAGIPFDAEHRARMEAWLENNRRSRSRRQHSYSLDQFGLTEAMLSQNGECALAGAASAAGYAT